MKESKSFEDALKRILVPEKKEVKKVPVPKRKRKSTYVAEAMGGRGQAMPGNATPAKASSGTGGGGGIAPFAKANDNNGTASIDMRDIGKIEDVKAKDHTNKPYPLNMVMDLIANSGESLQNAQSILELALKKNNVSISKEQKKLLQGAHQALKSSLGNIVKAAQSIDVINI